MMKDICACMCNLPVVLSCESRAEVAIGVEEVGPPEGWSFRITNNFRETKFTFILDEYKRNFVEHTTITVLEDRALLYGQVMRFIYGCELVRQWWN